MKNLIKSSFLIILSITGFTSCDKDDISTPEVTAFYEQADHKGRPAVNTVFIAAANKDKFNTTAPSAQSGAFKSEIMAKLSAFGYVKNALGQDNSPFQDYWQQMS